MGFIREIRQNTVDSHQSSPGMVLTFMRWSNRDTFNYDTPGNLDIRIPLVVYNDCIRVSVSNTKSGLMPTMTATLKGGDLDYSTALSPGDFVFVNMLNWSTDAERVRIKAGNLQPINNIGDGFKGLFKIQSVVEEVTTQANGVKTVNYTITANGFTELNNKMYYNPSIAAAFSDVSTNLWQYAISSFFTSRLKGRSSIQAIIPDLFKILIGQASGNKNDKIQNFGNTHFKVPSGVGRLLGVKEARYATDIYNYVIGVWKGSRGNFTVSGTNIGPSMNPGISLFDSPNFFNTGTPLQGNKKAELSDWNQNSAWSIVKGYLNPVMNEMYTTYRVNEFNQVMPTVIVRQKTFTTPHFKEEGIPVTRFLDIPRWRVSANLMTKKKTAKNDAARFNFVQVYTLTLNENGVKGPTQAEQIASRNFVSDNKDIQRNGLRPYVVTSNFDFPEKTADRRLRARPWSRIVADWIIDGHLKESGTFSFYGLQDPISVGDNIEFDNIVYHIETINHIMATMPNGNKVFRTNISVSYGIDKRSSKTGPVYAKMEHTDSHTRKIEDFANENILPGIGDTQAILGRSDGEELSETKQLSFTPANLRKKRIKTPESNSGIDTNHGKLDNGKPRGTKK